METEQVFAPPTHCDEEHWISVSDLMAGLMIIFLFIAITYIRPMQGIVDDFSKVQEDLYQALMREFRNDLQKWGAEIDKPTLSVRFKSPEILFDTAQVKLKQEFKDILSDFFPRYAAVLSQFRDNIEEIRIEGHTSSEWAGVTSWDQAYFNNMKLSQGRTREVLAFGLTLPGIRPLKAWLVKKLTANGLSSSQPVVRYGEEIKEQSRRVEFRVRTNAKHYIDRILETAGEN